MNTMTWLKQHLLLTCLIIIVVIIGVIITGLMIAPDLFYDQWIWRYYWGPIVADAGGDPVHNGVYVQEGYTFVSEITYGIILICALFGIYKLLKKLRISLDWRFFLALLPYIIFGPVTRVLEDALFFYEPFVYWFISPLIYVQIAFFAVGFVLLGYWIQKSQRNYVGSATMILMGGIATLIYSLVWLGDVSFSVYMVEPWIIGILMFLGVSPVFYHEYRQQLTINTIICAGGLMLLLPALYPVGRWIAGIQWGITNGVRFDVFLLITGLVALITFLVVVVGYWGRSKPSLAVLNHPLNLAMVVGHMVDGLTSYVSIYDPLKMGLPLYVEKHPASDFLMQLWPPLFPIVKFVLVIVIIYVFDVLYKDDLVRYGWLGNLLKIGIVILGFSPGVRDLLRVTMGV